VRQNLDRIRFNYSSGKWLIYDHRRWRMDDQGAIVGRAKDTASRIYDELKAADGDDARQKELFKWARQSQSRERIAAMIELAKPDVPVGLDDLDANRWLLNCQNGTVDLRTGMLLPHSRADYCTKICRAKYDPFAQAPIFGKFLARIFRTHPALIPFVQKALGYSLTGEISEQALFFLYGKGANGKTTLLDAVQWVMADYAGKADPDLLTYSDYPTHPTNVADLRGRRLAVVSETNEGRRVDEARLKDLTGERKLKARYMRQDLFEFDPTHKIWMYSNHLPLMRGTDMGLWRRIKLIPFVETIGDDEKDKALPDKLRAEADGILAWLVQGCLDWQRDGLGMPDEVAHATDGYRREMDSIGLFLESCCIFGLKLTAGSSELYSAYSKWCDESGERPLSQKRLGLALREKGLQPDRDSYARRAIWWGIGLLKSRDPSDNVIPELD